VARKRVYITVKTYPTLSEKYDELVCTAGIDENGSWIRLYPLPFRKLDHEQKYKKWQWIEVDVERRTQDIRPETYRVVNLDSLKILPDKSGKVDWDKRKQIIFKTEKAFTNKAEILKLTKTNPPIRTLLIFKPAKIIKFYAKPTERNWPDGKLDTIKRKAKQLSLFQTADEVIKEFEVVTKLPYEFRYVFADDEGVESDLMVEDWEIGALYFNCLKNAEGNEDIALEKVKQKYWDDFSKKDVFLFLGTRLRDQVRSPNPFGIVGVFYPPIEKQGNLF